MSVMAKSGRSELFSEFNLDVAHEEGNTKRIIPRTNPFLRTLSIRLMTSLAVVIYCFNLKVMEGIKKEKGLV